MSLQREDDDEIEILEIIGLEESSVEEVLPEGDAVAADASDLVLEFDEDDADEDDVPTSAADERARRIRLQADFDNYKKRSEREREADQRQASVRVVQNLLPVLDNFERAIGSASAEESKSSFHKGVHLIFRHVLDELRREGLEAIDTVGQPFDPARHEAVATEEHGDLPHHTIMEEMQRGYMLHERLLRPALVKVSTRPGNEDAATPASERLDHG